MAGSVLLPKAGGPDCALGAPAEWKSQHTPLVLSRSSRFHLFSAGSCRTMEGHAGQVKLFHLETSYLVQDLVGIFYRYDWLTDWILSALCRAICIGDWTLSMWMPLEEGDKKLVDIQIAGPSVKTRVVQYHVSLCVPLMQLNKCVGILWSKDTILLRDFFPGVWFDTDSVWCNEDKLTSPWASHCAWTASVAPICRDRSDHIIAQ